jgi:hypothetical protein
MKTFKLMALALVTAAAAGVPGTSAATPSCVGQYASTFAREGGRTFGADTSFGAQVRVPTELRGRRRRAVRTRTAKHLLIARTAGRRAGRHPPGPGRSRDCLALARAPRTERRRSRTDRAVGYTTAQVLKTHPRTGPRRVSIRHPGR